MKTWHHKVNIKQFLTKDAISEPVARNIVAELNRVSVFKADEEMQETSEEMIDAGIDGNTREFNYLLDRVYDFADVESIWLGL